MATFRSQILLLLLTLVVVTQVATLVTLLVQTNRKGEERAREELQNAGRVLDALMLTRGEQLRDAVSVLASDYGFKEAVAYGDTATLRSALDNSAQRIHADFAALIDLDGGIIASTQATLTQAPNSDLRALAVAAHAPEHKLRYQSFGGAPHLLVAAPVQAPTTVAVAVMGFALDGQLAGSLTRLLGVEVLFHDATSDRVHASTQSSQPTRRRIVAEARAPLARAHIVVVDGIAYMSLSQAVTAGDDSLRVILQRSMDDALAPFAELRTIMLLITAAGLLLSLPLAKVLARHASRPLDALVEAARRIEIGNYTEPVTVTGAEEFSRVAGTLDSMRQRVAEREARIRHQATHDALTSLPNRLYADECLRQYLASTDPGQARLALLLVDIKDFGQISASLGHAVSDEVLKELARRFLVRAGDSATVARSGVSEFLVIMRGADRAVARAFAGQLLESVRSGLIWEEVPITLDAHVALTLFPEHGESAPELLRRLDSALHDAREANASIAEYRPGRDEDRRRQFAILGDLRRAAADYGLNLHYQPKIDMRTQRVVSLEALIRWRHPTHGQITPAEFIPLAERTGNVILLTSWVLKNAVRQMREWQSLGFVPDVSVNLSAADLHDPELTALVLGHLRRYDVPPTRLVLEITESAIMREIERAVRVIEELRHHGIRFSIDDFGTGYSSLAQFKRLPVDEIKIDSAFVADLQSGSDDEVIVRSIIDLGHNFGVKVVAEGVETSESWEMLRRLGCDMAQGFLIGHPLPGTEIPESVSGLNARLERAITATQQLRVLSDQRGEPTDSPAAATSPGSSSIISGVRRRR